MAPTFPFTRPDHFEVFAVDDTTAQMVWRGRASGSLLLVVDGREIDAGDAARPVVVEIDGLEPGTGHVVDVVVDGTLTAHRSFATQPALDGEELTRIATISDLHLGEEGFGLVKPMRERPRPTTDYPLRCAIAAVREAAAWGAELLVIKGDITDSGRPEHWAQLDELLAASPLPVLAVPGNHDTWGKRGSLDAGEQLRSRGLFTDAVQTLDRPGVRVVVADSTVPRHSWGRLRHRRDELREAIDTDRPALLLLHHHLQTRPVPTFWPIGTPRRDGDVTLAALLEANTDLVVSSGHTHRNRARRHAGALVTEVGSTKDHPGVWAGYTVHRHGIRQTVRRVADPTCLEWTERTRAAVGGIWGRWSPGRLTDRCVVHHWTDTRRPITTDLVRRARR